MSAVLEAKPILPERVVNRGYGLFGYEGSVTDSAIWLNNVEQIEEIVRLGFIEPETETFDGMRLVKVARKRGSEAVAKKLIELGWADEKWPHPAQREIVWGMDGKASIKTA
jgi:hypothetical protein